MADDAVARGEAGLGGLDGLDDLLGILRGGPVGVDDRQVGGHAEVFQARGAGGGELIVAGDGFAVLRLAGRQVEFLPDADGQTRGGVGPDPLDDDPLA